MSSEISGIVPIAGGNQHIALGVCSATSGVPVLAMHGTNDTSWPYLGGPTRGSCVPVGNCNLVAVFDENVIVGPSSIGEWRARNGCAATGSPTSVNLPDSDPADQTSVTKLTYNCSTPLQILQVNLGGHTWPGGYQYAAVSTVGRTTYDISANSEMLTFFKAIVANSGPGNSSARSLAPAWIIVGVLLALWM
jgi:polyhydroxybutyrate depolymerase